MVTSILALMPIAALAGGAIAASMSAPLSCPWPNLDNSVLKRRLAALGDDLPGTARRVVGMTALALVFTGGAALAYAAEPAVSPVERSTSLVLSPLVVQPSAVDQPAALQAPRPEASAPVDDSAAAVPAIARSLALNDGRFVGSIDPQTTRIGLTDAQVAAVLAGRIYSFTTGQGGRLVAASSAPAQSPSTSSESAPGPSAAPSIATLQAYAAQTAQAAADAQTELDMAVAALQSASPNARAAAQAAVQAAQIKLVFTKNNAIRYRAIADQGGDPAAAYAQGLTAAPGDPIPAPGAPGALGSQVSVEQAVGALRIATARAQQDPGPAAQQAVQDAQAVVTRALAAQARGVLPPPSP